MKPLFQEPGDKQCLRISVASLFGLSLEEVPFFGGRLAFTPGKEGEREIETHAELRAWLKERGLGYVYIRNGEKEPIPMEPWGVCVAFGPTARGTYHAVVWDVCWHLGDRHAQHPQGWGRMLHDPHPDGTGLTQVDGWYCFTVRDPAVFVRFALARAARLVETAVREGRTPGGVPVSLYGAELLRDVLGHASDGSWGASNKIIAEDVPREADDSRRSSSSDSGRDVQTHVHAQATSLDESVPLDPLVCSSCLLNQPQDCSGIETCRRAREAQKEALS